MIMRQWVWLGWVALLAGRLLAAPDAVTGGDVDRLRGQVDKLRAAGKPADAVVTCEAFLKAHPDAGWFTGAAVGLVYSIAYKEYADPVTRRQLLQRIVDGFEACPQYYVWAACDLGLSYLWWPGVDHDPAKAETLLATAADKMKGKLPAWAPSYPPLLVHLADARLQQGKNDEAVAGLKEALRVHPRLRDG